MANLGMNMEASGSRVYGERVWDLDTEQTQDDNSTVQIKSPRDDLLHLTLSMTARAVVAAMAVMDVMASMAVMVPVMSSKGIQDYGKPTTH